ncbi:SMI1/KNR4 family protein [Bacillus gobiensis]|uniref:SMI1/KNR4 family protein n=1 Tax=Bacillus gobiensis TaxID=1441095 RepID=UPI003D24B9ED
MTKLETQLNRLETIEECDMNAGVSLEVIDAFETKYGLVLPNEMKQYLQRFNGGDIDGLVLAQLYDENTPYERVNDYIERLEDTEFAEVTTIKDLLVFAIESYGDMYFIHVPSGEIYWWGHENDRLRKKWKSIASFLEKQLDDLEEESPELFF